MSVQAISSSIEDRPTSAAVRRWISEGLSEVEAAWKVGGLTSVQQDHFPCLQVALEELDTGNVDPLPCWHSKCWVDALMVVCVHTQWTTVIVFAVLKTWRKSSVACSLLQAETPSGQG